MAHQTFRLGDHGDGVLHVQQQLNSTGAHLDADGVFGLLTDRALRAYQRTRGIVPADGIAGPKTLAVLDGHEEPQVAPEVAHLAVGAVHQSRATACDLTLAQPASSMDISADGLAFIARREELRGVTNRLHHPSAASGVTLGAGYDMKMRSQSEISETLRLAGVPSDVAKKVALGASKSGSDADKFVKDNRSLVNLSEEQQATLLSATVPPYVDRVSRSITAPLHQYEFDALVSFAYNPGGGWRHVADAVNQLKYIEAMQILSRQVYSGHKRYEGLVNRRRFESHLFLFGLYQ